jgi:hypothetical protein
MKQKGYLFTLTTLLVSLFACSSEPYGLRLIPISYQSVDAGALQAIFEQKSHLHIRRAEQDPERRPALERLVEGEADLAFVHNSMPFVSGVRAVLPAHRAVLHVLGDEGLENLDTGISLRGKSVYIANTSPAARALVRLAAMRQKVDEREYRLVDSLEPGMADLVVYLGPIVPEAPAWYRPGYRFTFLQNKPGGSGTRSPEMVKYLFPGMYATVIPARTYDIPGNEENISTIGTDTLLVTRKDVPERVVYELTRTLLEQKSRFTAVAPQLFREINESFDPLALSFPLHSGARRYIARDEPGLLERYAETINMLVYLMFLLLTGLLGLARWRLRRKKDRIDTFYTRVLAIRERASGEDREQLLDELTRLEDEAFHALIAERLAADESFRIFTDLLVRTRAEVRDR